MFQSIAEAVLHYAKEQPDKFCLADDGGQVTYAEYAEMIGAYASVFHQAGLTKGAAVVVEACQTVEYLAIELALELIGAVFVPTEHNCAMDKIAAFAEEAEAAAVITCKEGTFDLPYVWTFSQLLQLRTTAEAYVPQTLPQADELCQMLFSTGTTGKEKGILLTHRNNVALAENVVYGVEMKPDNVELIPSPMNHSHGLRRYYANMYLGASVVLLGSVMNVKQLFYDLDTYHVNSMDLVPTALSVILRLTKEKLSAYQDRLRYVQFGAAPMMQADQDRICELLPKTRLYNFYGSTESGCTCIYNFNDPAAKQHCIGKPTHNVTFYLVDENRQPLTHTDADHTGLLASAGAMNMLGYWKNPEETAKVLQNGIVYSNDVAYIDEDGDIILLGRKGDVINVGGHKVSPEEIENAAKKMTGIADCGVIAVEDAMKGKVPKLFVQMQAGCVFDAMEIRSFLGNILEPYKIPVYIEQIAKIPRTGNGKLLRRELR